MSASTKLFAQFPPVSTEEWKDKIEADLKGADFEKKMVWRSIDGLTLNPFYRSEDLKSLPYLESLPGEYPFLRGAGKIDNSWYVRESVNVGDIESANKRALSLLNRGADSLCFSFNPYQEFSAEIIERLISGLFLEAIEINFSPAGFARGLTGSLREALKKRGTKLSTVKGSIENDPIGKLMVKGKLSAPVKESMDELESQIRDSADFPGLKMIRVDGSSFGNAGSTAVQELAMTLSMANEYMSLLTSGTLTPDEVAGKICFRFGIGSSYFIEIAKLRAARMLWATIVKKYNTESTDSMKMDIHSVSSEWNKTIYDPYVNMLRTQTEAMSAILGGADSLTLLPFDVSFAAPSEFSERIARNQQLLLKEESYFDKIADPAAGSYYIENITSSIAEQAWKLFIEIEDEGGFLEALKKGTIQLRLNETRLSRMRELAMGREKLLGTNIYPDFKEKLDKLSRADSETFAAEENEIEPLTIGRAASRFEKLRMATEQHKSRPIVFLLTIGELTMRKARAQFSTNFFAVAGYEIIERNGYSTVKEGIMEARKLKAQIIVLCSSDDEYERFGPEAKRLISDNELLVIAGAPLCSNMLKENGIEHFVNTRSNILETLEKFNSLLGIGVQKGEKQL